MPRTKFRKQPLAKISEKENVESSITKTNFTAMTEKKLVDCIADLNQLRDRYLAQIDTKERQLKMVFKFDIMKHKTLEQLKNESGETSIDSLSVQSVHQNSCDEESSEFTSSKTTSKVTFNTTSSNMTMNSSNMSAFKTPMVNNFMSKEAALAAGYITPKVKPNRPLTVLRRAQPGEMVVSMTGSPVLVQAIDAERPNVNVPLADGRIISVQPQNSIRRSEIPEIDETTRKYLQTLRDNLDKIVNHVK
ncbi:uncharacterized protein LOC123295289 isoform X2 [Chrysoperla carnea]|uniref:uncharacterized protein LOC123295289 isoform X2 n=1 Tax=Chrysoperla carnea TaxID=189513 RepID=UPI001D073BFC|nr:uncharacterized protein LOC123295289 isoform X2 [Chrysoperla carnea]